MTRIVCSLSVFCESFSKSTFGFSYVLFLASFAFYHINQVLRFARHLLFDFSHFPSVVKCVVCSFIINVWASETSMFGVAAESAKRMVGLSGGCWALKFRANQYVTKIW